MNIKWPNKFAEGDLVKFVSGYVHGTGIIRGVASMEVPILGASWIVEMKTSNKPVEYPFSHMAFFENQLELV